MKKLLTIAASLALVAAACGGGSGGESAGVDPGNCPVDALENASGPVEVVMWETFTGEPLRSMQQLVQEYNASQDRVVVRMENQGVGYEEIQRKFNTAIANRSLGGLVVLEDTQTQFMADSGVIVPAEACAEADDYDLDQFSPVVRSFYSVDDALQPAASNLSTGVMYYNRDHLEAAGLNPDEPPGTLDELRAASEAIKAAAIPGVQEPFVLVLQPWFIEHWLTGDGVAIVNNNNGRDGVATEGDFNNPTTAKLYAWLQGMYNDGLLKAVPGTEGQVDHYFAMALEQSSITVETSTAISTINAVLEGTLDPAEVGLSADSLPAIDINVDVAPYPGLAGDGSVNAIGTSGPGSVQAGGGAFYIPNTNPPEVIAAAWDFMKWFNTPAIQAKWMPGSTYIAWNENAFDEQALTDWETSTRPGRWLSVAVAEIDGLDPSFPGPLIGPYTEVRTAIRQSLDELLLGGQAPETVIAKANNTITRALERYNDENF
jgi:sn-glycerol 3-phosphate transport system substrate-binding protein